MIIGVDFDGTVVEHAYPDIGAPILGAIDTLKELIEAKHRIILWTMRSGDRLAQADWYMRYNGVEPYGLNTNPTQRTWTQSPKAFCNLYIDDAALGCPLVHPEDGSRPYVDWTKVRLQLVMRGVLE